MFAWFLRALALLVLVAMPPAPSQAQRGPATPTPTPAPAAPAPPAARSAPPHAWLFGSWTGGFYPPGDTSGPACAGQPSVIFTRDVVMRSSPLDVAYRQRLIETVAAQPNGVEFRFSPAAPTISVFGAQPPGRDSAFGCASVNSLTVERRGPNEIVFPNCSEFPSPLHRCQ